MQEQPDKEETNEPEVEPLSSEAPDTLQPAEAQPIDRHPVGFLVLVHARNPLASGHGVAHAEIVMSALPKATVEPV